MVLAPAFKVLVVDDERPIRRFLSALLGGLYKLFEAESGEQALQLAAIDSPDLILLDLGLPGMDGADVIRRLREWSDVPVIVISVRESEQDKLAAFEAGADDYLVKPFSPNELLARMRVALRRSDKSGCAPEVYQNRELRVDLVKRDVRVRENRVMLTPTEYDILRTMVNNVGRVLTHHHLIQQVWGGDYGADMHLLRVNISNLRRKIETDPLRPQYIITEPGIGYRLKDVEKSSQP